MHKADDNDFEGLVNKVSSRNHASYIGLRWKSSKGSRKHLIRKRAVSLQCSLLAGTYLTCWNLFTQPSLRSMSFWKGPMELRMQPYSFHFLG